MNLWLRAQQPSRSDLIDKLCEQAVEIALLKQQPRREVRKDWREYQARKADKTRQLRTELGLGA